MPPPRRGILLSNPVAGRRGARLDAVRRALVAHGWTIDTRVTDHRGHATEVCRKAARTDSVEAVFVLGGDGTLREAAAGLLGGSVALGPLPGGTANVLTLALGLSRDPVQAAVDIAGRTPRSMDVGFCDEAPFLMMCSLGFDAEVVARHRPFLKRWLGRTGLAIDAITSLATARLPPIRFETEAGRFEARYLAACNIPLYGGRMELAPGARWDDGLLDLVAFTGSSRAQLLGFALDAIRGNHLRRNDVTLTRLARLEVADSPTVPVQVDGDLLRSHPPLSIRVGDERLSVLGA